MGISRLFDPRRVLATQKGTILRTEIRGGEMVREHNFLYHNSTDMLVGSGPASNDAVGVAHLVEKSLARGCLL